MPSPAARPPRRNIALPWARTQVPLTSFLLVALAVLFFTLQALPRTWFNDDAFITFRYAEHVAEGEGWRWNPGQERIEGSTSLGWTLLLAAAVRLGADPLQSAHVLGLVAGALALIVVGFWAHRRRWPWAAQVGVLAFLAFQKQWLLWSVSAMETVMAGLCACIATLQMLRELDDSPPVSEPRSASPSASLRWRGVSSGLLFFVATLFRPEMPLLHLTGALGAWWAASAATSLQPAGIGRAQAWRVLLLSGATHALCLGLLTAWRQWMFGQPLPNPFYVKVGALQWQAGLVWWLEFLAQNRLSLLLLFLLVALPWSWRRSREAAAISVQVIVWSLWIIAIGGGRWEFRWMVPVLPLLAVGFGASLLTLRGRTPVPRSALLTWGACLAVLVSQFQALRSPFQPFGDVLSADQLTQSVHIMGNEAASLGRYLGPEDRVCIGWAGVFPYITRVQHFDPWGLNDKEIARRPFDASGTVFHQRHATWDDVVARDVLISDVFNHFLFARAYDGRRIRVVPWVKPGIDVYSVQLPEGHYWLFASARSPEAVARWLESRGLEVHTRVPLPAGLPRIGG